MNGPPFRVLARLGPSTGKPAILPLTVEKLREYVDADSHPMILREWAVGWLAALPVEQGWRAAAAVLASENKPIEIRRAAARWLGTHSPAQALQGIREVMWKNSSPDDLEVACYYTLTWSPHEEAKGMISDAAKHPNAQIRSAASRMD